MKFYSFDVDGERLEQLPLAARRALDHAGRKLSLAAWGGLDRAQRLELVRLGSAAQVDVKRVRDSLQGALPAPLAVAELPDPPGDAPPEVVAQSYAALGGLSKAVWASLGPLDRYALYKVSLGGKPERLAAAYAEVVGHTRVSTHLRPEGGVQMVNVGDKAVTRRRAEAESHVHMSREAFELLAAHAVPKGDVLATARIAGIMAAKRTPELIPLCHALALTHVAVDLELEAARFAVHIKAAVETVGKTGVEMEALVAASHAALTIYDMLKAVDRAMEIGPTRLISKSGGASGDFAARSET